MKNPACLRRRDFGGSWWIRTTEALRSRFTVCPHWPLGKAPIFTFVPCGVSPSRVLAYYSRHFAEMQALFSNFFAFFGGAFPAGAAARRARPGRRAAKRRPRQSGAGARTLRFCRASGKPAKPQNRKTGRWQRSQRPVLVRFCGKGTLGVRRQRGCPVLLPAYAGRAACRGGGQPPVWGWWYTKPPSSLSSV